MPLPPELEQKIGNRFDELIKEASKVSSDADCEAFFVKCLNLTDTLFGNSERGKKIEKRINHHSNDWIPSTACQLIKGTLQGLKDDFENGFLGNLEEVIVADISADYMTQVEDLLDEGKPNQFDHVPAAVLCGAVLEDAIRRLCERQSPPISTKKRGGSFKKLTAMIDELQKANVYNPLKRDQLQSYAKIRNSASHGRFSEFDRNDVESMIEGVKNFLSDYL